MQSEIRQIKDKMQALSDDQQTEFKQLEREVEAKNKEAAPLQAQDNDLKKEMENLQEQVNSDQLEVDIIEQQELIDELKTPEAEAEVKGLKKVIDAIKKLIKELTQPQEEIDDLDNLTEAGYLQPPARGQSSGTKEKQQAIRLLQLNHGVKERFLIRVKNLGVPILGQNSRNALKKDLLVVRKNKLAELMTQQLEKTTQAEVKQLQAQIATAKLKGEAYQAQETLLQNKLETLQEQKIKVMHQGIEYQHRIEQKRKEVAGLEVHDTLKERLAAYWHSIFYDDLAEIKTDTKKDKSEEKISDLEKENAQKALAKAKSNARVNTYRSLVQKIKVELEQLNINIGQLEAQDKLDPAQAEELKLLQYTSELLQSNLDYFNELYQGYVDDQTVIKKEIEVIQAQLLVTQDELALLIQIEQKAVLVRDQKAQENKAKIEQAETEIAKLNIQLDMHRKSLQSILNRHKIEENQDKIKQANIELLKLTKQAD
ncbi:MAG: hypothetical protein KAI72_01725, partial [Candidatus Pacebacteria bacterium]|nr:hypothetical protein [Candidatus Paceibacterota bacterium]